jgi:hypothetical protein
MISKSSKIKNQPELRYVFSWILKVKKNTWYNGIKLTFPNQIELFDTKIIYFSGIKLVLIICFSLLFKSI